MVDQSMTVPVLVFQNLRKGRPVSVSVLSNMDEKPDRTGLPSTTIYIDYLHRMGSLPKSEPFMNVHHGQSGSCQMLLISEGSLTYEQPFWNFMTLGALQWITFTSSYPHDVKKDGLLLLRLLGTECLGFENYILQATSKDTHLQHNIAGEWAEVRQP